MCKPELLVATWDSICPTLRGAHEWIVEQAGYTIRRADCPYCGAFWIGAEDEVAFYRKYGKDSYYLGSDVGFDLKMKQFTHFRYI